MRTSKRIVPVVALLAAAGCGPQPTKPPEEAVSAPRPLEKYAAVRLAADLSGLSPGERQMIPLLIEAAQAMDEVFWMQAYGDREALLSSIADPDLRRFAEINYGPWDRLDGNAPFIEGVGPKPAGANFYPPNMTPEEFEAAVASDPARASEFRSLYTVIRRGDLGALEAVPYHEAFAEPMARAASKLREAAALAGNSSLGRYLESRAEALLTSRYLESDLAWMEMKDNNVDIVIGPIETYEDQLFGTKAAAEAFVLVKDPEWSRRLARYAAFLPDLQKGLPVPEEYRREVPGAESDLNVYDVLYYAGDCNAGSKTIAINLPNDEQVQAAKGTRRLQLENAMRAKFDRIMVPIAKQLIAPEQLNHVTFDAFFENTLFHEVAHGLGIQRTLGAGSTVREALRDQHAALEEGKADVLGLYMVTWLGSRGELGARDLHDNYVTFLASIFRSIRFGASNAHGRANLARLGFFEERGAFTRDEATGTYRVDFDRMTEAMNALSERILRLQGDGDYQGAKEFMESGTKVAPALERDLGRLASAGIPVDIVFEQGLGVLGP